MNVKYDLLVCKICKRPASLLTSYDGSDVCDACLRSMHLSEEFDHSEVGKINRYVEYLKSERWKTLAEACKSLAGFRCKLCSGIENLNAHHRSYSSVRAPDEISDLVCLCNKCHLRFHEIVK